MLLSHMMLHDFSVAHAENYTINENYMALTSIRTILSYVSAMNRRFNNMIHKNDCNCKIEQPQARHFTINKLLADYHNLFKEE